MEQTQRTTLPVQLRQLVTHRTRLKQAIKDNQATVKEIDEELKQLVEVGQTAEIDGYKISHYEGRGEVEADAWAMDVKSDPEIREIEETYQRAKAVRDERRAEYKWVTTCLRITVAPK